MKISVGLIMYDVIDDIGKILLVKSGGPYFKNVKRSYGIPKGLIDNGETMLIGAIREFIEETGIVPHSPYHSIDFIKYKYKTVYAWIFKGEFPGKITSNYFEMEYPPKSGKIQKFPENESGKMVTLKEAESIIFKNQLPFLERIKTFFDFKNIRYE